jgi:outer membrane protein assembly factor BamB
VRGDVAVAADFKGRVAAVKTSDGSVLWTHELKEPVYSSAALTPALAVVGCHDGHVYGFALETGARVFDVATGGPVVSSPVALGDRFLAASTDGQLYLFDATGRVLARLSVAAEGVQSSPALDATGLVVGSGRGLHAFRLTA